jgi:hypothetical protein
MTQQGPPFESGADRAVGCRWGLSFELFFSLSLRRRVWLILDKRLTFSRQGEVLDHTIALKEGYAYLQRVKGHAPAQGQA